MRRINDMRRMKLEIAGRKYDCLVGKYGNSDFVFTSDVWKNFDDICAENGYISRFTWREYAEEVISNGDYYTSCTFQLYNPWEDGDCINECEIDFPIVKYRFDVFVPGAEALDIDLADIKKQISLKSLKLNNMEI